MEKAMSIKNIVFDLGRVLIKFEPKEYTEQNIPEEKREAFYNGVFGSDEWQMLDRGTLSYEDAKKIFKERIPGVDEQIDRLFDVDLFEILPCKEYETANYKDLSEGAKDSMNIFIKNSRNLFKKHNIFIEEKE